MKMYLMTFLVLLAPLAHADMFSGTAAQTSRLCTELRPALEGKWLGKLTTPDGKKTYIEPAFLPWNGKSFMTMYRGNNLIEETIVITNDSYTPRFGEARESCRLKWNGVDVKLTKWHSEAMQTDIPNSNTSNLEMYASKLTFEGEVYGQFGTFELSR